MREAWRRRFVALAGAAVAGTSTVIMAGCVSGRVLTGYPGYPFASFEVPPAPDSAFYRLQYVLENEGYPIDYTDRESGLINTRPGPDPDRPLFLTVVIGPASSGSGRTEVWIAGFETTVTGARRVNPLDDALWSDVMAISARVSERMGGTAPVGPDERAALEKRAPDWPSGAGDP